MMRAVVLACAVLLAGCFRAPNAGVPIDYTCATREEGQKLLALNEDYYRGMSETDIAYRLQKTDGSLDELKAYGQSQVRAFSDAQKDYLRRGMTDLIGRIERRGVHLPPVEGLTFVLTTQKEECGSSGYTHGSAIYLSPREVNALNTSNARMKDAGCYFLAHELFHCLTRNNPQFRREMYAVIGFTVCEREFEIPECVREMFISNPDVAHHNSYATFRIDGKDVPCYLVTIATRPFKHKGDSFFSCFEPRLIPVEDTSRAYAKDEVENFWEVFGQNTPYVIDPEETLADNFALAVTYGEKGPYGKGYPSQKLIDEILDILRKE